ncbi:delta-1-pyrroline-5-carboxylate dehydrogenase, mitochondrial [Scaptodrosophila lebanonensis]|uniref:Delta-1-pyrroline-5-carboxylate dehydrogenase, mitochondrial n=1 Tax=Drosophila lebanonensis TaxID=7225 RepID=A0A6J2T9A1_DROLE|nr:delta-1-pyrroline-5-carboxylate dehydrogenase, mitochondrial [Scaptodrosophila lebanonensis]
MHKLGVITATCQAQCCRFLSLCRHLSTADASSEMVPIPKADQLQQTDAYEESESRVRKRNLVTSHVLSQCRYRRKPLEVPTVVNTEEIYTNDTQTVTYPHEHNVCLARVYYANRCQIESAIKSALAAQGAWSLVPASERLHIWRKAADLIELEAPYLIAHIVLGLGRTLMDASNDVRRLISTLRSNADYMEHLSLLRFEIHCDSNVFPKFQLRPMDGIVAAMASFESASMSANLALCPALMGNTVLWNPALEVAPASYLIYQAFKRAGLPKGVINFVPANERLFLNTITDATHFSGLNYHGDAEKYRYIFKLVGDKMHNFICFPRLVAECYGKNFHFVHSSANVKHVCSSILEAAFTFAGQNANSLSRIYVPLSMWPELRKRLQESVKSLKMGDPAMPETQMGPVINREAFTRLKQLIERSINAYKLDFVCGGVCDDTTGYFVQPTIAVVTDPLSELLSQPILGPFLPVFVYADDSLNEALRLAAHQSKYSLSGSIFASKDEVISHCLTNLRMSASNLYVNERCTGNLRGLTPFGGNRLSGTNDKSGSAYFLMRWSSPLLIEETINPIER